VRHLGNPAGRGERPAGGYRGSNHPVNNGIKFLRKGVFNNGNAFIVLWNKTFIENKDIKCFGEIILQYNFTNGLLE
jgi:hypothetical protein